MPGALHVPLFASVLMILIPAFAMCPCLTVSLKRLLSPCFAPANAETRRTQTSGSVGSEKSTKNSFRIKI